MKRQFSIGEEVIDEVLNTKKLNVNTNNFYGKEFFEEKYIDSQVPLTKDIQSNLGLESVSDLIFQEKKIDKKILFICLGGTISMVESDKGLVVKKGALQELMKNYKPLFDSEYVAKNGMKEDKPEEIEWYITPKSIYHKRTWYQFLEIDEPIDSSNINTKIYIYIAELIEKHYKDYDGFIIAHGTDTMCYTASVLSFMLQNLQKTIILTGSMIPLCEPENDAFNNLVCSLLIVGHFTIPEVCIFMNDRLIRGNRSKKSYSMGWNAFDSPMYPVLALFTSEKDVNMPTLSIYHDQIRDQSQNHMPFKVHKVLSEAISVIQITPTLHMDVVKYICTNSKIEGIIIESYGAGNIPSANPYLIELLKGAVIRGCVVVNISQCYHSEVLPIYQAGNVLKEIGVVFGYDMTIEAAVSKLQYLLMKKHLKKDQIRTLMRTPIRGELSIPQFKKEKENQEEKDQQKEMQNRPYSLYPEDKQEEEKLKNLLQEDDDKISVKSQ